MRRYRTDMWQILNKKLIVTVDTEGDNLWAWHEGGIIRTANAVFIPRFQELCERYGLIPTYLTNYEMAMDNGWVVYGRKKQQQGKCEIGLHIHAWNSPPIYPLNNIYGGNSYITEYPEDIIYTKIDTLKKILIDRFECDVKAARSGRWATNESYFKVLSKVGIIVDCSITPAIDFSNIPGCSIDKGSNYTKALKTPSLIYPDVIEIPMTTRLVKWNAEGTLKHRIKSLLLGDIMWLRPFKLSKTYLKTITDTVNKEGTEYMEFMIHSSELMPGGSPFVRNIEEVEQLYGIMDWFFKYISDLGFVGSGLTKYAEKIRDDLR